MDGTSFEKLAVSLEPTSPLVAGFLRGCQGLSEEQMFKAAQSAMALDPDIAEEFEKCGWTWGGLGRGALQVGGNILGSISGGLAGSALASPGVGTFAGGMAGGTAGDAAGKWLGDKLFGAADPQNPTTLGSAAGEAATGATAAAGAYGGARLGGMAANALTKSLTNAPNIYAKGLGYGLQGLSGLAGYFGGEHLGNKAFGKAGNNEASSCTSMPVESDPPKPTKPLPDPKPNSDIAVVPPEGGAVGMGPASGQPGIGQSYDKVAICGCSPLHPYGLEKDAGLIPMSLIRAWGSKALGLGGRLLGGAAPALEGAAAKGLAGEAAPLAEGALAKGVAGEGAAALRPGPVPRLGAGTEGGIIPELPAGAGTHVRPTPEVSPDMAMPDSDRARFAALGKAPEGLANFSGQAGLSERPDFATNPRVEPGPASGDYGLADYLPGGRMAGPVATMKQPSTALTVWQPPAEAATSRQMVSSTPLVTPAPARPVPGLLAGPAAAAPSGGPSATMQPPPAAPGFAHGPGPMPAAQPGLLHRGIQAAPGYALRGVTGMASNVGPLMAYDRFANSGQRAEQAQAQASEAQAGSLAAAAGDGDQAFGQFINSPGLNPAVSGVLKQMWAQPELRAQLTNQQQAAQIMHALNTASKRGLSGPSLYRYAINQLQPGAAESFMPKQAFDMARLEEILGTAKAKMTPWAQRAQGYGTSWGRAVQDRYMPGALQRNIFNRPFADMPHKWNSWMDKVLERSTPLGELGANKLQGQLVGQNHAENVLGGLDNFKGQIGLNRLGTGAGDAVLGGGVAAGGYGLSKLLSGGDKQADFQMPSSLGEGLQNASKGIGDVWSGLQPQHKAMLLGGGGAMLAGALRGATSPEGDHSGLGVGVGGLLTALYGASGGNLSQLGPNLGQMTGMFSGTGSAPTMGGARNNPGLPPGNLAAAAPSAMSKFVNPDGSPRIAEIVKAPDQELLAGLKQMDPQARQALQQKIVGFKPSMGQNLGARAMGIDLEGQRARFLKLLQTG